MDDQTYQKEKPKIVEDIKRSVKRIMEQNNANPNYIGMALQFAERNMGNYEPEIRRMAQFREEARAARDSGDAEKFEQKTAAYGRYSARVAQSIRMSYNASVLQSNKEKLKEIAREKAKAHT
ncbi:MAG: hypothetical protein QXU82_00315 [Candidatus Aenigmatarchaeota archaeon]